MSAAELKFGDYVIATKYSDGDPQDPWCVGFFSHRENDRIFVVDNNGKHFRAGGFRRAKKITHERGAAILSCKEDIKMSGRSIWGFVRLPLHRFAKDSQS